MIRFNLYLNVRALSTGHEATEENNSTTTPFERRTLRLTNNIIIISFSYLFCAFAHLPLEQDAGKFDTFNCCWTYFEDLFEVVC